MKVVKRDGRVIEFDIFRVSDAIKNAMASVNKSADIEKAHEIAHIIKQKLEESESDISVEYIQDLTIKELYKADLDDVAKSYSEYRHEKNRLRKTSKSKYKFLSNEFLSQYKHRPDPFPTELGKMVYYRTYSRPLPEEGRREYWWETVARVVDFNCSLQGNHLLQNEAEEIYDLMYNLKLFPSGRSLWVGGTKASYKFPLSNFNCSLLTIDSLEKFSEILFVLMLGVGVGLSVESKYISLLPKVNTRIEIIHSDYVPVKKHERKEHTEIKCIGKSALEIEIGDSKSGWKEALKYYFEIISSKQFDDVEFIILNYNNIRPYGESLKTFGGTASGHIAVKTMFSKIEKLISSKKQLNSMWYKLKPIDCLDIATMIAENVVSGGVRRSSEIIFCDADDTEVLEAKNNLYQAENGWNINKDMVHRTLSNNTVMYRSKPTKEKLNSHFESIKISAEPGFANFEEMLKRRPNVKGMNPCAEVLLDDRQTCNLTEVNLLGFIDESGFIDYDGIYKAQMYSARIGYRMATIDLELHQWNLAAKRDMLIGCSLTGVMDFISASGIEMDEFRKILKKLKLIARESADKLAEQLNMNKSLLTTCGKPSGSVSQLPTVSSGCHYSHSPYYIRRVRVNAKDPVCQALVACGFEWKPENGQTVENHTTKVFSFPIKAPVGRTKGDVGAIEQLEMYKLLMENYIEHNQSNTIHVKPDEWGAVCNWVYDNWDSIVGMTFINFDDTYYQQLPYESISKEQYFEMSLRQPIFNPNMIKQFENFEEFELEADCESGLCGVR